MRGSLTFRLYLIIGILFGIIFLIITLISQETLILNSIIAFAILLIQYLISPYLIEAFYKIKYLSEEEAPEIHAMVEEMCFNAGIPKPKIGVSEINIANAFAFGRSIKDGRICLTKNLINLLNKNELKAVIGHELAHIKNRDSVVTILVSFIPTLLYYLFRFFSFSSRSSSERNNDSSGGISLSFLFLILYFISNLLVLAISRVREFFADYYSIKFGNSPEHLASALYKIVYYSTKLDDYTLDSVTGFKALFLNDPNNAMNEIRSLKEIDLNKDFSIDFSELQNLKESKIKISLIEKLSEIFTTHPNVLKRIKKLSEYS
ncbi:MAG: zinc metalloprotease HtpX [Spirochaetes bacterium]|nr:zinc metalloprotease HtpX [Spirochaetota bacterium]